MSDDLKVIWKILGVMTAFWTAIYLSMLAAEYLFGEPFAAPIIALGTIVVVLVIWTIADFVKRLDKKEK